MSKFYENSKMFFMKHHAALKVAGSIFGAGIVVGTPYLSSLSPIPEKSVTETYDDDINSIKNSSSKPILSEIDYFMNVDADNEIGYETVSVKDIAFTVATTSGTTKLLASRDLSYNGNSDVMQKQALKYTKNEYSGKDNEYREVKVFECAYLVYNEDGTSEYRFVSDLKNYAEEIEADKEKSKTLTK